MNIWLLQALEDYDIATEAKVGKKQYWRIHDYYNEMRKGEVALLWQAGAKSGVYAIAKLKDKSYREAGKHWVDVIFKKVLQPPIYRTQLLLHPVLAELTVIRRPQGSSFKVNERQWKAFKELIDHDPAADIQKKEDESADAGKFNPKNMRDARKRIAASIVLRRGQPAFRQNLLKHYHGRCAISGCSVEAALEACHIVPFKGARTDDPSNGLLLRADLHALFDLHLITVKTKTMTVMLAPELKTSDYAEWEGRRLSYPTAPSKNALDIHRGEFKKIRGC